MLLSHVRVYVPGVHTRRLRARIGEAVQQLAVSLPARADGLVALLARAPSRLEQEYQESEES